MSVKGLRGIVSYDAMETIRNTNEWMGATARAIGAYPAFALVPHPAFRMLGAWGRVTERSFARMVIKPDWEIPLSPERTGRTTSSMSSRSCAGPSAT